MKLKFSQHEVYINPETSSEGSTVFKKLLDLLGGETELRKIYDEHTEVFPNSHITKIVLGGNYHYNGACIVISEENASGEDK